MISFVLNSILSHIKMATPACFVGPFPWNIFFHHFYTEVMTIFDIKVYFLAGSWFQIHSGSLCLLFGKLRSLTLRDINDQCLLIPVILLLFASVYICPSSRLI